MHHGQSRGSQKRPKIGGTFINLAEIWGICKTHHWFKGDGRPYE